MSKELEALNRMVSFDKKCEFIPQQLKDDFQLIEEALNELEDAKHNYKAVKEMYNNSVAYGTTIQKELNELKKRNEPIKLKTKRVKVSIDDYRIDDYCPTCDEELYTTSNYCPHCGQKLDWSDEK